jgi:hypothetical protein
MLSRVRWPQLKSVPVAILSPHYRHTPHTFNGAERQAIRDRTLETGAGRGGREMTRCYHCGAARQQAESAMMAKVVELPLAEQAARFPGEEGLEAKHPEMKTPLNPYRTGCPESAICAGRSRPASTKYQFKGPYLQHQKDPISFDLFTSQQSSLAAHCGPPCGRVPMRVPPAGQAYCSKRSHFRSTAA